SAATGGDLARSPRWSDVLSPYGVGDELRCVGVDERGCWSEFLFWRDVADRPFDVDDARMLRDAAPALGTLARRAIVTGGQPPPPPRGRGRRPRTHTPRPRGPPPRARAGSGPPPRAPRAGAPPVVGGVGGPLRGGGRGEKGRPPGAGGPPAEGRGGVPDAARL